MSNLIHKINKVFFALLVAFSLLSIVAPAANAQQTANNNQVENSEVTAVICKAIEQLTGPIGRAIAVLIIISIAIALFLGKVTWGLAIAVAVGLGILFGATNVVGLLTGVESNAICATN